MTTDSTRQFGDPLGKQSLDHRTPGVQPARNMWLFDPGVFVDDNGQAHIHFGGNADDNVRVARLRRDMISFDGEVVKMTATNFFEAAWVFKRNGIYYFSSPGATVLCSTWITGSLSSVFCPNPVSALAS